MATQEIVRKVNAVPADGEWFNLEVDNDVDPMSVVIFVGYNADGWKYLGKLTGKRTYRAKFVDLGYVRNLAEAGENADERGYRLVEGQAREPFKAKFPRYDGKGPIAFGGSEWQDANGHANVACLSTLKGKWCPLFHRSDKPFGWIVSLSKSGSDWRWLVVDK